LSDNSGLKKMFCLVLFFVGVKSCYNNLFTLYPFLWGIAGFNVYVTDNCWRCDDGKKKCKTLFFAVAEFFADCSLDPASAYFDSLFVGSLPVFAGEGERFSGLGVGVVV